MADRPFVGAESNYDYGGSRLDKYCDRCGLLPAWCACPPLTAEESALTEAECDAVLASAGMDADAEFKRAQEMMDGSPPRDLGEAIHAVLLEQQPGGALDPRRHDGDGPDVHPRYGGLFPRK